MKNRNGLTMLEVIFAMVVILVGMVAIGLMIPLAGREAEDSVQITHGLAAGDNALALFNTTNIAQPSLESPWCLVDDIGGAEHSVSTMQAAYDAAGRSRPAPQNELQVAIAQNEVASLGFCIDPLFWGFQARGGNQVPLPFFRTRFPFLFDHANPVTMIADQQNLPPAPRLLRGSLTDPRALTPGSWLRQPAAVRLATMYGGDIVQPETTKNKALGPIRSVYVAGDGSIISNPVASQQSSWLVTVTPSENTPSITLDRAREAIAKHGYTVFANQPIDIPRVYDVALVVFSKRDAREINAVTAVQGATPPVLNIPAGELVFNVVNMTDDAINSGTFNVTIQGAPGTEESVSVGNWLMMSRFSYEEILPRLNSELIANPSRPSRYFKRQIHRWYRVVGVSQGSGGAKVLKLSGKPWGWTEREIEMLQNYPRNGNNGYPPLVPPKPNNPSIANDPNPLFPFDLDLRRNNIPPVIQAVVLKDVVQVYERQMELR